MEWGQKILKVEVNNFNGVSKNVRNNGIELENKDVIKNEKSAGIKIQQRMKWNDENKEITYDNETN